MEEDTVPLQEYRPRKEKSAPYTDEIQCESGDLQWNCKGLQTPVNFHPGIEDTGIIRSTDGTQTQMISCDTINQTCLIVST